MTGWYKIKNRKAFSFGGDSRVTSGRSLVTCTPTRGDTKSSQHCQVWHVRPRKVSTSAETPFPTAQATPAQSPGAGCREGAFQPSHRPGRPCDSHRAQPLSPQPESPLRPISLPGGCWPSPTGLGHWALGGTSSEVRGTASRKGCLGSHSAHLAFSLFLVFLLSPALPQPCPLSPSSPQTLLNLDSHRISCSAEQSRGQGEGGLSHPLRAGSVAWPSIAAIFGDRHSGLAAQPRS